MQVLPDRRGAYPLGVARAGRAQRRGEDLVALDRLLRRDAAQAVPEGALALREVGRPHLQDRVREAELEDRPGDGCERRGAADLLALPQLVPVTALEAPEVLRRRGAELDAAVEPEDLEAPRVRVAGRDALGLQRQGEVADGGVQ